MFTHMDWPVALLLQRLHCCSFRNTAGISFEKGIAQPGARYCAYRNKNYRIGGNNRWKAFYAVLQFGYFPMILPYIVLIFSGVSINLGIPGIKNKLFFIVENVFPAQFSFLYWNGIQFMISIY